MARAGIKTAQLNDSSRSPNILFSIFSISNGLRYGHKQLYQYITTFNLINITIKNIAINTGRLWRRPVLGQSEIVCTVAILDVQGDTAISRRTLAFRRGVLNGTTVHRQILLVFGIKDINSHIQILNLTSTNYYQVKHFENIDPAFQKQG